MKKIVIAVVMCAMLSACNAATNPHINRATTTPVGAAIGALTTRDAVDPRGPGRMMNVFGSATSGYLYGQSYEDYREYQRKIGGQ